MKGRKEEGQRFEKKKGRGTETCKKGRKRDRDLKERKEEKQRLERKKGRGTDT